MIKGIIKVVLFYLIGFGLIYLTYIINKTAIDYGHGAGIILIYEFFLLLLLSLLWLSVSLFKFYLRIKTKELKAIIITNSMLLIGFILIVLLTK